MFHSAVMARNMFPFLAYQLCLNSWTFFYSVILQDFLFNNIDSGLQDVLAQSYLVSPGCQRQEVCSNHGCKHGSSCVDEWNRYSCRCPSGFVGSFCERQITATFDRDDSSGLMFTSVANITSFSLEFSTDPSVTRGVLAFTGVSYVNRSPETRSFLTPPFL